MFWNSQNSYCTCVKQQQKFHICICKDVWTSDIPGTMDSDDVIRIQSTLVFIKVLLYGGKMTSKMISLMDSYLKNKKEKNNQLSSNNSSKTISKLFTAFAWGHLTICEPISAC